MKHLSIEEIKYYFHEKKDLMLLGLFLVTSCLIFSVFSILNRPGEKLNEEYGLIQRVFLEDSLTTAHILKLEVFTCGGHVLYLSNLDKKRPEEGLVVRMQTRTRLLTKSVFVEHWEVLASRDEFEEICEIKSKSESQIKSKKSEKIIGVR